ncbi:sulfite exporter TauE/SafE family protein [Microlunatus sp. GCM10028923]|uniref:sulfite exporter TauE/SafE family protein n=1 Tax=Microlunatus sp. GCM10028923 TaxID=3273400 RepID=UPI003607EC09
MSPVEILLILLAGVGAGTINAVVGSGTMITFPTLITFGYEPVTATMSNAIGLVPGSASGSWGYRRELKGQGRRLLQLLPASLLGAICGAWLLLHLPPSVFRFIVPFLLGLALILVIAQPRIQAWARRRTEATGADGQTLTRGRTVLLIFLVFLVGIYGGYFTAAQGILLVGVMGALIPESLQRLNAVKNVLALAVNVVAAVTYTLVAFDRISWPVVGLIAVGSLAGGFLGAHFGRRLPPIALRTIIVVLGVIAIARLLLIP